MGLSESEWEKMHPALAEEMIERWTEKQKREDIRNSLVRLTMAQTGGCKINGRSPRLKDFLPEYAKPSSEEEGMAEVARELAKLKALENQNG